ncbi:glycosyltransferase [Helicobacter sp. 16-1353]|uniref:glycosyltransferase family 2 protein n=1 Tax=Helicobacter sp. 16-1353 TaxID=2004996 RepID=UPI000DCD4C5F|nr:glycosyltransferase family 2 protein [Helicobacter sp. 16-1353]RAX52452.1 glycosyltransferase [Helicobacter sp. 16-1353]
MEKVSIITVVFNDENNIKSTMESVLSQSYQHVEYIIIDGKSSDSTLEVILNTLKDIATTTREEKSKDRFLRECVKTSNPNFSIKILSERDSGIYDAMNKGIDLATGMWCNFMNSGDRFYSKNSITELFNEYQKYLNRGGVVCSIIYGNSELIYDKNHSKILKCTTKEHKYKHHFIHQAAFIDAKLMKKYHYDTGFKIAGDTDFFVKSYRNGERFLHFEVVVCSFNLTGISSNLTFQIFKEDCKIGYKYNRFFPLQHTFTYLFWIIPRFAIRKILPKNLEAKARMIFGKKRQ